MDTAKNTAYIPHKMKCENRIGCENRAKHIAMHRHTQLSVKNYIEYEYCSSQCENHTKFSVSTAWTVKTEQNAA